MAKPSSALLKGRALTSELAKLASEIHTTRSDGTQITREEALAELLWKQALGWEEEIRDPKTGMREVIKHPPVSWALTLIWERLEGKAAQAAPENRGGMKAAEKVRALARERLNDIAAGKCSPPPQEDESVG